MGHFYEMIREGLSNKTTFEQRPRRDEAERDKVSEGQNSRQMK